MKTVVIIPIKQKSVRVPGKNFKKINGKPLFEYTLNKIKHCNFDEIYVDTDSKKVKKFCEKNKINIINRLSSLNENTAVVMTYKTASIISRLIFSNFICSSTT